MYIDPSLNSVATVLANLYQSFYEAAIRCCEYAKVLAKVRSVGGGLLISTYCLFRKRARCVNMQCMVAAKFPDQSIHTDQTLETVTNIIALAFVMLQRRSRSRTHNINDWQTSGVISRRQVQWYMPPAPRLVLRGVAAPGTNSTKRGVRVTSD
jgi:hypothetical protein